MDKTTQELLEALVARSSALGLSLRKLSDLTGVSFATLSRLQRFETEPDESTKARIANWLQSEKISIASKLESVAEVHFRAAKNIDSKTVESLLRLADHVKKQYS